MILYPAIDLRRGKCVRLRQGDPDAETVFGDDPAQMAQHWVGQGAEWLHVVNLDGAFGAAPAQIQALHSSPTVRIQAPDQEGSRTALAQFELDLPINLRRLIEIKRAVDVPIQFGGGMRTLDDVRLALELGAERVVLGTVAVEQPRLVADALERWGPERILVGIDARDGMVATHGWQQTSALPAIELGHRMYALGVRTVVYTDIGRDGMLTGVNVQATAYLGDVTGLKVIASGGVAGIRDIELLKANEHYNIDGVIVGQAIYTGALDLPAAIQMAANPLCWRSAGTVPFRRGAGGTRFLLLYNMCQEQWQFPRTLLADGDSEEAGARRSLECETALPLVALHLDTRITLDYQTTIREYCVERHSVYFLAETGGDEVCMSNEDHCEARWVDAQEAWELLTETSPELLPALEAAVQYLQLQETHDSTGNGVAGA